MNCAVAEDAVTDEVSQISGSVCVVAGEASGDEHTAAVIRQLKMIAPNLRVFGMGGSKLCAEGVDIIVDSETSGSVMGLTELFGSLRKIIKAYKTIERQCRARNPELVILVDFPDFNLRLAKKLKKPGRKILYFISPQLWAWRSGRVETIRRYVDHVASIFPFEESFYHQHHVSAEYVGHPFLDEPYTGPDRTAFLTSIGANPSAPSIAMLPGSRKPEVERLFGPMVGAFEKIRKARPGIQAIVPVAPTVRLADLKRYFPSEKKGLFLVEGQARAVLMNCDVAVVASGTATVEAAVAAVPFLAVYKLSPMSYRIARLLVRGVRYFAMPNLIAGQKVVEELLQDEVTAERIAEELEHLIGDPAYRESVRGKLVKVRERLETGESAAKRTAKVALQLIEEQPEEGARRWKRKIR